ncbi:hypothetical protein [uncultured Roseibium sp.]|uniref:hypothetical protein n=1 Tax=uncultured Roseibium sp. TaxID=1936171 RepID=UPI003217B253
MLACALVAIIADASKSIAQSELVLLPFGQLWFDRSPDTLNMAQAAIQRHVSPFLWDPVIQTLLTWPVWAVFGLFGLIFLWLGTRSNRRAVVLV